MGESGALQCGCSIGGRGWGFCCVDAHSAGRPSSVRVPGALGRAMGGLALGCGPVLLLPERGEEGGGGLPWPLDPR